MLKRAINNTREAILLPLRIPVTGEHLQSQHSKGQGRRLAQPRPPGQTLRKREKPNLDTMFLEHCVPGKYLVLTF